MDQEALLLRLIDSVTQSAGADRSLLILFDEARQPRVVAEARLRQPGEHRDIPLSAYPELARRAVDLALRTGETVRIDNPADSDLLREDAYCKNTGVRSLLASCIELNQRILGLIYLENHVTAGAFGPARVEIVDALGAQAGIALENARLYRNLREALRVQAELTDANRRFVPTEFLSGLGCESIVEVSLNEAAEREMAVVFVDLRGFTHLSEELGPRRTIEMINRYLSYVQPAIAEHQGFVGQYYGDGILALFPRGADDAVGASVAMCRGLEAYNRERGDFPELRFGIGIHSGSLILGTVGSADHFQCGVVGDSVNLASRVEALTKFFKAVLLLSGPAYERLPEGRRQRYRHLGRVQVPGRAEIIDVYECLDGYPAQHQQALLAGIGAFGAAIAAYQAGKWNAAETGFETCRHYWAEDLVVQAALARVRERAAGNEAWDGVERPAKG
jgi:class 3 adenylate cyclase